MEIKKEESEDTVQVIQYIKQEPEADFLLILSSADEEEEDSSEDDNESIVKVETPKETAKKISFSDVGFSFSRNLPEPKQSFKCTDCPQVFKTQLLLKFHVEREHGEERIQNVITRDIMLLFCSLRHHRPQQIWKENREDTQRISVSSM
jgi:hypothetical protein